MISFVGGDKNIVNTFYIESLHSVFVSRVNVHCLSCKFYMSYGDLSRGRIFIIIGKDDKILYNLIK